MENSRLKYIFMLFLAVTFLLPNNSFGQEEKKVKKKVVIVKKTIDKDGNEKVEKIIKEGEDIDIDKLVKSVEDEKGNVEVDVEVTMEEVKEKDLDEKEVSVMVEGNQVKIINGDEVEIIQIEEGDGTQEIKTPDGKHIIIKRNSSEGEDLNVGEMLEDVNIDVTKDGQKEIRIIKKEGSGPNEEDAFFGVMIDPSIEGTELLNVVDGSPAQKAGLQRGDILRSINGQEINSFEELIKKLSQFKPEETIEISYDRNQKSNKVKTKLVRRGNVAGNKKMIWKTDDGEEIEIDDDHKLHFHRKNEKSKVKKEKIIIKKKIKKE